MARQRTSINGPAASRIVDQLAIMAMTEVERERGFPILDRAEFDRLDQGLRGDFATVLAEHLAIEPLERAA